MPETRRGFEERRIPANPASKAADSAPLGKSAAESASRLANGIVGARELHLVDGAQTPLYRSPSIEVAHPRQPDKLSKRALDVCGAILLGILFSPLIAALVL